MKNVEVVEIGDREMKKYKSQVYVRDIERPVLLRPLRKEPFVFERMPVKPPFR